MAHPAVLEQGSGRTTFLILEARLWRKKLA
ncbi:hypothetical protein BH20ACT7_BH20ACT7_01020 [soil metagenome]